MAPPAPAGCGGEMSTHKFAFVCGAQSLKQMNRALCEIIGKTGSVAETALQQGTESRLSGMHCARAGAGSRAAIAATRKSAKRGRRLKDTGCSLSRIGETSRGCRR